MRDREEEEEEEEEEARPLSLLTESYIIIPIKRALSFFWQSCIIIPIKRVLYLFDRVLYLVWQIPTPLPLSKESYTSSSFSSSSLLYPYQQSTTSLQRDRHETDTSKEPTFLSKWSYIPIKRVLYAFPKSPTSLPKGMMWNQFFVGFLFFKD